MCMHLNIEKMFKYTLKYANKYLNILKHFFYVVNKNNDTKLNQL